MHRARVFRTLAWGLLAMGLLSAGCRGFVESQVFFPERRLETTPAAAGLGYEDLWLDASDGTRLHAWLVPADQARFLVLFCHGNGGNISHRVDNLRRLHDLGVACLIFDYRGYGQSQGRPSEDGFFLDAEAALARARDLAPRHGQRLVIFGRSLGGIAATHIAAVAAQNPGAPQPAGLILESTFTHLGDMARNHFPLPLLGPALAGRFSAQKRIPQVQCPILFFHGDRDEIVPFGLGRKLFDAAPPAKQWITLAGAGHNDTYLVAGAAYWQAWREFLAGRAIDGHPAAQVEAISGKTTLPLE